MATLKKFDLSGKEIGTIQIDDAILEVSLLRFVIMDVSGQLAQKAEVKLLGPEENRTLKKGKSVPGKDVLQLLNTKGEGLFLVPSLNLISTCGSIRKSAERQFVL